MKRKVSERRKDGSMSHATVLLLSMTACLTRFWGQQLRKGKKKNKNGRLLISYLIILPPYTK